VSPSGRRGRQDREARPEAAHARVADIEARAGRDVAEATPETRRAGNGARRLDERREERDLKPRAEAQRTEQVFLESNVARSCCRRRVAAASRERTHHRPRAHLDADGAILERSQPRRRDQAGSDAAGLRGGGPRARRHAGGERQRDDRGHRRAVTESRRPPSPCHRRSR
jgi:hypothetical protein